MDRAAVFASEYLAAFKPLQVPVVSLLDPLAFDPTRTFGTFNTLAFDALRTLCRALRAFRALDMLAFDTVRPFRTLEALALRTLWTLRTLALDTLRTLGALEALTLRTLRTFSALGALALDALRSFGTLGALSLALTATLARLRATLAVMASSFGANWAGQRHGGNTSNQEKLASHYNLLAQSKVMNINRLQ